MFDKFILSDSNLSPAAREFLKAEASFFEGALRRSQNTPLAQREAWRKETVYERRLRISKEVYDLKKGVVSYGPLKGLRLSDSEWWGAADKASMIFGLYEQELLKTLTSPPFTNKSFFIDFGAADGYYGVGLVMANFYQQSFCFEITQKGRETIAQNAITNSVSERVTILGDAREIQSVNLAQSYLDDAVVLVDIEGAEFDILGPAFFKLFQNAYIVIEVHNWVDDFEQKYVRLLQAADPYFEIGTIEQGIRDLTSFSELLEFTDDNRYLICSEGRPNVMRFLKLMPKIDRSTTSQMS
jgi:hypothetical protein